LPPLFVQGRDGCNAVLSPIVRMARSTVRVPGE
jgi:hypothetical protein